MGDLYDYSDLPIVVFKDGVPIVYDGNRRMILAKIKLGFVQVSNFDSNLIALMPREIPCNVCSEDVALAHVDRKHGDSGSWSPLQRDIFRHKFLGDSKTPFLLLDEATGLISRNPHMDKGFVKKELFNNDKLNELGFHVSGGKFKSRYTVNQSKQILEDVSAKVLNKVITTRESRGRVVDVLEADNRKLIERKKDSAYKDLQLQGAKRAQPQRTRKTDKKPIKLFGENLVLQVGEVNNLYRDICDLNTYYGKHKNKLSQTFPSIIRMAMRLLCETASKEAGHRKIHSYINKHFLPAKKALDSDQKTLMRLQNVTETSLIQLLQTGAHSFTSSRNYEQTVGVSLILGQILKISHEKK